MGSLPSRDLQAKADLVATRLRGALGLSPHDRLDAFRLAAHLEILVLCPSKIKMPRKAVASILKKDNGWSAVTVLIDGRPFIAHNTTHDLERQQSNLFHELGHIVCKHEPLPIPLSSGLHRAEFNRCQEDEAGCTGACLHLPRAALGLAKQKGWTFEKTCEHYCASTQMLQWRLNMTRLQLPRARKSA